MTDQVESLDVGFQDGVSAGAKAATDAIKGLGDAAAAAEAKTERAGRGMKKATDEVAAGAAAAKKAIGEFAGEVERSNEPVRRASQTAEQLANKFDRAKREAGAVARAIAPYQKALEDLEKSSAGAVEKEELRATITAKMEAATEKARAAVARYFKDVEAGAAAANASAAGLSAGMAAMTASANSWAGALGKVYETAGSMSGGLNQAARALRDLNAGFASDHVSFAEWTAGAKGLEASLRGVSAAQKAINDSTGVSRQNVNTATIGALKYAVTGNAAPTGNTLGLVTGDADATAERLDALTAAFAEADAALDGYRERLGLVDVAQRKFEAGQKELQGTIRLSGIEEAEGARLLAAYAAAHDPAIKKAKDLAAAQATAAKEAAQAERAALTQMSADWDAAVREREADAAMIVAAEKEAAAAVKQEETALRSLVGTLDRTFGAEERMTAQQRLLDRAMTEGVGGIRISREQHEALTRALKEQHEIATRSASSTKLAAHESLNLGYQIQDFVVQVGSGQGILTPLLQQAPQAVGAVGGVGRAVALLTSPIALATMGTLALGGAMAVVIARAVEVSAHTRRLSVDIQAMGNASGVSAGQLRAIETQLRQQGVSGDAAFASVRTLAGARALPSSMLGDVASIGRNMAAGTDDVAESVKSLTDALTEGYAGIRKLDDQFNFLTVDERRQIETMARHGDQAGVLKTAIDALHRQFDGLHEKALSPAGAAMERLSAGYNRLLDSIASRPIVIKGLEALALLLDKTAGSVGAPTRAEQIAGMRHELSELDKQYSRLPEKTSGVQTAHEAIILRRIDLQTKLNELQKEGAATQSSQIRTGAPRTAGTSSARTGAPDPAAAKYVDEQAAAFDRLSDAMQGNAVQRALAAADMKAEDEIRDRRLRGAAADEITTLRRKEAILQLTVAVNDNNRVAAADIAGNDLVARAHSVSTTAVREAQIQQKAMAEAARGTIEPYDAIVARLRAVDDAQRAVQAAQFDATLKQQTDDANRLAAAWEKGAGAAREAALANEVLGEARKRGLDPERDAGEIGNIGAGVMARDMAQRTQQFAQMASEQRRAAEMTSAEFDMLGQSNAERAKTVAILQASNDLRDKGADLTDAGTKAYIEQAGEIAKVKSVLQDAAQTAANIAQPISSAFEDVIVGAKGAGDAVKALGEDLKRIAVRQLVTKPFETAVSGTLTRLMTDGVSVANDNRPTPANDPGGLDRLISTVKGGLGSSSSNPMWVTMSSGSAAYDVGAMMSGSPMPVAIKDAGNLEGVIQGAAAKYGIDPSIIKGIIQQESSWNASAINKTSGAAGLMQIMPANLRAYGVSNAFDPAENIDTGTRILKEHLVRAGGDMDKALSTYSGHIKTSGAAYVAAVKGSAATYAQAGNGLKLVVDNTQGVTAAQERQLQAMLDAVPVQQQAANSAQSLTSAQESLVASVLGTATAQRSATDVTAASASVINVQTASISTLGANAITLADHMDGAADGAKSLTKASEDSSDALLSGARTVFSGLSSIVSSVWSSVTSLFSGGGSGASPLVAANQNSGLTGGAGGQSYVPANQNAAISAFGGGSSPLSVGGLVSKASGGWLDRQLGGSITSASNWLNSPIAGFQELPAGMYGPAAPNVSILGNASWGDALGAAGYGFNAISNFSNGNVVGGIGNTAAAVAAIVAPEFAPFIAIGTQLLSGLFGKDRGSPAAAARVEYTGTKLTGGDQATDNEGSSEQAQQLYDSINAATAQFMSVSGAKTPNGAFGIGVEAKDGEYKAYTGSGDIGSFGTLDEAVIAQFRKNIADGLITASDDVLKAVNNSTKTDINEFMADVSFGKDFRAQFDAMNAALDPTNNQIKTYTENAKALGEQVKTSITDWKDTAKDLGLATDAELVTAAKRGITAMMGLGPAVEPLRGMAAVTKQAAIEFEAFSPALAALGHTTAEVADLAVRYTAKAQKAYQDAVAYTQRQGAAAINGLTDSTAKTSVLDRLQGAGLDPENKAIQSLAGVIGDVEAAAKRGVLTMQDERWALAQLDAQRAAGQLTADQYGSAVGMLTQAWADSAAAAEAAAEKVRAAEDLTVRSMLAQGMDPQADDYARRLAAQREYQEAEQSGYSATYLAGLRYVQGLEDIAAVTARAAEAQEAAVSSQRAAEDRTVRSLRAQGMTTQADDYAQALDRQREIQDAIAEGYDAASIAGLRYILAIEAANAATEKRAAIEAANADIYSRALTAVGNTVQAAANAFDLTATQKRKEAIATGLSGQDLANLDAVLAAERGQTVFQAAQQSVLDWYDREISAKSELVTSIQDGALKIAQAAKQFQQAADSIRLSEDAPISPQERLTEAKRQWDAALGTINSSTASDTDKDTARSALTSLGQTLVSIEKTNSAGTARAIYDDVLKVLGDLGDLSALGDGVATAEADLKVAQDSLKELQKARSEAANYGQRTVGNLENLHATMVAANDNYLTAINGLSSMLSQTKPVAPDKGGTTAAQQAGQWMTDWFTEYDKYAAESKAGHLSEAEWQTQGAALWQSKVDKTNSLPLDPLVWNAFIQAAASASAGADTAAWLRQVAHDKGVPGYAVGTMATPPGAVWVGERGPELLWQDGGAAVASSADSMRIAGLWQSAANDRWSGNVSSFQPPAPARPVSSDGSAAIVAELRRLNAQIVELKQGLRDAEGDAQDQRDVLLTKLIRAVESMKAQLADLKPARAA